MMAMDKNEIGALGERIAAQYLQQHHYKLVTTNFSTKAGEVDIIAEQGDTFVFIEVKTRQSTAYGQPAQAVTKAKQKRIIKASLAYIQKQQLTDTNMRFDIIEVLYIHDIQQDANVNHIENAFDASAFRYFY
jgi:putative endonuclease